MTTYVAMLRHGETDWNAQKRIQGQIDVKLNNLGCEQAREMANTVSRYRFAAIYSSDLSRAYDTAQPLAERLGLGVISMPQLRERHLGMFQGWSGEEAKSRWPDEYARYQRRDPEQDLGDGESLYHLQRRVVTVCTELSARHEGEHIALVTHAGVIDIVYRYVLGRSLQAPRDFSIGNASIHYFSFDKCGWCLLPRAGNKDAKLAGKETIE